MANEIKKRDAVASLKPGAEWVLRGDTLEWLDSEQTEPSSDAIAAEVTRLQGVYDNNDYQRTRAAAYADVKEQLDLLYHDMAADKGTKAGEWFKAVAAVKTAIPK